MSKSLDYQTRHLVVCLAKLSQYGYEHTPRYICENFNSIVRHRTHYVVRTKDLSGLHAEKGSIYVFHVHITGKIIKILKKSINSKHYVKLF